MTTEVLLLLSAGFVLLIAGGELLVRGAARLAAVLGVSPLVIGLTVVAYGTSTPEMAVSIKAGLASQDGIAVANVVGSNIFNVLFILGACALIAPLTVNRQLVRFDVPVMIAVSVLALVLALDGRFVAWEGVVLVVGVVAYTAWSVRQSRRQQAAEAAGEEAQVELAGVRAGWLAVLAAAAAATWGGWALGWVGTVEAVVVSVGAAVFALGSVLARGGRSASDVLHQIGFVAGGLGVLVIGARWLVDGAVELAVGLGVSETVVGLTIVAAGTSLPEVATSIVATVRGQRDIAIGNVVGSNIYNILAILGISTLVTPGGLAVAPQMVTFDVPVMLAIAVACLPVFYSGYLIRRWEGGLFLVLYIGYTAFLILQSTGADAGALGTFVRLFGYVVVPFACAAFVWTGLRAVLSQRRRDA